MRAIMIAMLAGAAIWFFNPSDASAAPANGAVVGKAATVGQMIHKARRYRRYPRRRGPYYTYRPAPSDTETLHQLSEENQQRAQQNSALGGQ